MKQLLLHFYLLGQSEASHAPHVCMGYPWRFRVVNCRFSIAYKYEIINKQ